VDRSTVATTTFVPVWNHKIERYDFIEFVLVRAFRDVDTDRDRVGNRFFVALRLLVWTYISDG
jgi:hypothetical protein